MRDIDILCVQETKICSYDEERDFVKFFQDWFWVRHASGTGQSAGTAVLVRKSSGVQVIDCERGERGRIVAVDILWKNELIRIVSIYAPNDGA